MQDRIFYGVCFGFLFGIFLRSIQDIDFYFFIFLLGITLVVMFYCKYISKTKGGIVASLFILAILFGIFRFDYMENHLSLTLESQVGSKIELEGIIIDAIEERLDNQHILVKTNLGGANILVSTILGDKYRYGDAVHIKGKLEKPENFITDQGKEFDYINYLKKDGILYVMNFAQVSVLSHGHGSLIKSYLFDLKENFISRIDAVIPQPENLLMKGLILGEKANFNDEQRQDFINTGTIHIVALSGYNVTIVAEWFMKVLRTIEFLPQNFGISFGIISIILFVVMTGGSSTAVRAGIMATLALIARATGRTYDVGRALLIACVLMVLINPYILYFDVSFQLSFIATVAVIFYAPRTEKYFYWVTENFALRDIINVTFATYIFVLPFIIYKMGNFSLVALPANIMILPFIPITMGLGFLTGALGAISYALSAPLGYASYLLLHYELFMIKLFANLPFASLAISDFPMVLTIAFYLYFIWFLFGKNIEKLFINKDF